MLYNLSPEVSVAAWIKRSVAVAEGSGSSPGRGGRREPFDYISFHRAVERQWFHTLNTHHTKPRTTQQHSLQTPYTLELDIGPFPIDVAHSFPLE